MNTNTDRDSADEHRDYPHRLIQADTFDGSMRVVSWFSNKEEAMKRAYTQNMKYPAGLWLYMPPGGFESIRKSEDVRR